MTTFHNSIQLPEVHLLSIFVYQGGKNFVKCIICWTVSIRSYKYVNNRNYEKIIKVENVKEIILNSQLLRMIALYVDGNSTINIAHKIIIYLKVSNN